jgi:hypothetical protein
MHHVPSISPISATAARFLSYEETEAAASYCRKCASHIHFIRQISERWAVPCRVWRRLVLPRWHATRIIWIMFYGLRCRIVSFVAMVLGLAPVARGQADANAGPTLPVPVPASTAWLAAVLLGLMWLLIAAVILGPLVRFFAAKPPPEPRNLPGSY